jgi:lysophospholipase L1-like esterase
MIRPRSAVLFQGDSITDAGRDRDEPGPNLAHALGWGYCNHVAAQLLRARASDGLRFYNRGISGNRIVDLYSRWKIDAVNLKPDVISILVGVNDTWHEFTDSNGVELDRFETVYRMLLDYTSQQLPGAQFILCEPFALMCGVVTQAFIQDVGARRKIVKALSEEYQSRFVPFQRAMDDALTLAPPEYWTVDGVHPTAAGHSLLARCWLRTVTQKD